ADTPIRYLYSDGSVWDGVPGSDEADGGMGGTVRWFVDITERDTYFTENPGQLREGISVGAGDPVTAFTFDGTQWLLGALAFKGEKGDPGDGISDSPLDGTLYGRKDGDWTEVDATSILFADGETLQDKLNRGALGGAEWEDF
ncbi:MAG: hypothetical protein FWB91_13050, partial [Defluviitaleaceae bacterium]|nr:hypothetical protein [Defluviitaleaceae bacterium]